jgi:hypothetical protein
MYIYCTVNIYFENSLKVKSLLSPVVYSLFENSLNMKSLLSPVVHSLFDSQISVLSRRSYRRAVEFTD